jgi:hypothetical protein
LKGRSEVSSCTFYGSLHRKHKSRVERGSEVQSDE